MGISGKAWRKLAAAVAVPGAAIGALAGFGVGPAMASTARPSPVAIETLHGHVAGTGLSPEVPVQESGAFSDHGYIAMRSDGHIINLSGNRQTVRLSRGNIYFGTSHDHYMGTIARQSCTWAYTETFSYGITGGTGRYQGARGSGRARIQVTAVLRRQHGHCTLGEPTPGTVSVTIDARGSFYHGAM